MSIYLKGAAFYGSVWGIGDFFAQFYAAHKEAAARRARGEKREGGRPSGQQMFEMLDKPRVAQAALFGLAMGPCMAQYAVFLPRIFGNLQRQGTACLCALGLQQLVMTPLILWSYFTAMTAARGGFRDPSFMSANVSGAHQRHDVFSIQSYIATDVLPYPLLVSWGVYAPCYAMQYLGPVRGASFLTGCLFVPWCGLVSCTQEQDLL